MEFKIVDNAEKYIERKEIIHGQTVCFINSDEWFEQYETDDNESLVGWCVPYTLLDDCSLYLQEYDDDYGQKRYFGMALYNPMETFLETFEDLTECINWLTDYEGEDEE